MAGVPETLRTGSCLPQHVNLPYMQEGEREGIVEGDLGGAAAGPGEHPGSAAAFWRGRHPPYAAPEQTPPNRRAQATKR